MHVWAIKYMDLDERWWVDLVVQDDPPDVEYVTTGARMLCDGFKAAAGLALARKVSIPATDLGDWPSEVPVMLTVASRQPAPRRG